MALWESQSCICYSQQLQPSRTSDFADAKKNQKSAEIEKVTQSTKPEKAPEIEKVKPELKEASSDSATSTSPTPAGRVVTLEQAHELAAENNPSFKNVKEQIYQAEMDVQQAWGMLLPNLTATGSITLNDREIGQSEMMGEIDPSAISPDAHPATPDVLREIGAMFSQDRLIQERWGRAFGFSANIAIFNPRSIPGIQIANELSDKTRVEGQVAKNALLLAVTNAYFQVNSLKTLIEVAEENRSIAQEFLRLSQAQKRVGQSTKIDVLRAQIQVTTAEKELANARDGYQHALSTLGNLIGIKGEFSTAPVQQIDSSVDTVERSVTRALKNRVELKAANLEQSIADLSETEAWMQWLPSFDATFLWDYNSTPIFSDQNASWKLIFGAKWDLFKGGTRIAELNKRASQIRMANNSHNQVELDIRKEVEQSYLEVNKQKRNLELAEQKLLLAEQNHKLVSKQYEVGMASSLELADASTEFASARTNKVYNQLQYEIAVVGMNKAIGIYHPLSKDE